MVEKKDIVMIKVERETREQLKARGKKGDSYEDVISAMLSELDKEQAI